jgi:hypothetical protein
VNAKGLLISDKLLFVPIISSTFLQRCLAPDNVRKILFYIHLGQIRNPNIEIRDKYEILINEI